MHADSGEPTPAFADVWEMFEAGALISQCAWCSRVLLHDDWVYAPRAALAAIDVRLTMSHTICPHCVDAAIAAKRLRPHEDE